MGVRYLLLFVACANLWTSCWGQGLSVRVGQSTKAEVTLSVGGVDWMTSSGMATVIDGTAFSTANGTLFGSNATITAGQDSIGAFEQWTFDWKATPGGEIRLRSFVRAYSNESAAQFGVVWPNGANGTASQPPSRSKMSDPPSTVWPLLTAAAGGPSSLSVFEWVGSNAGTMTSAGDWPSGIKGGYASGAMTVYATESGRPNPTMVISLLQSSYNMQMAKATASSAGLAVGLAPTLTSVPPGFTISSLVYAETAKSASSSPVSSTRGREGRAFTRPGGINSAAQAWGDLVLRWGQSKASRVSRDSSVRMRQLGMSTTANYFYNPCDNSTLAPDVAAGCVSAGFGPLCNCSSYEDSLHQVLDGYREAKIPIMTVLLDSWWYGERNNGGGVLAWTDEPFLTRNTSMFPSGGLTQWYAEENAALASFWNNQPGFGLAPALDVAAHAGLINTDNVYQHSPGAYPAMTWASYESQPQPVPLGPEYFDFVLGSNKAWGLNTIKQDHHYEIMDQTAPQTNPEVRRLFEEGLNSAALNAGSQRMYCMTTAPFMLSSVSAPAATHGRSGSDYITGGEKNYQITSTSLWLWAVGVRPYKDTFFSTNHVSPTNPLAPYHNKPETASWTQALVSIMSGGPVAASDGARGQNNTELWQLIRLDGLLLGFDRPATSTDASIMQLQAHSDTVVSYTETTLPCSQSGLQSWSFVLAAGSIANTTVLSDTDLLRVPSTHARQWFDFDFAAQRFASTAGQMPVDVGATSYTAPRFLMVAPVLENGWTLLGETGKYAAISGQRIQSIDDTKTTNLAVAVLGLKGESITLVAISPAGKELSETAVLIATGQSQPIVFSG